MNSTPLLVVLSGPAGVGKDSILAQLRAAGRPFHFTVTATTRSPRPGERNGVDYYFYSESQFQEVLERGGFLEHAAVYAHRYGVPKAPVLAALAEGRDVIMRTDVQGAATIKREVSGAILIFVAPPSVESLLTRMQRRDADTPDDVALRLGKVRDEMATLPLFDYVVVNEEGQLDRCVADVEAILRAEKLRVNVRPSGFRSPADAQCRANPVVEAELAELRQQLAPLLHARATAPDPALLRQRSEEHHAFVQTLDHWLRARAFDTMPER